MPSEGYSPSVCLLLPPRATSLPKSDIPTGSVLHWLDLIFVKVYKVSNEILTDMNDRTHYNSDRERYRLIHIT